MSRTIGLVALAVLTVAGVALTAEPQLLDATVALTRAVVTVANWPLDEEGNLRVAEKGQPSVAVSNFPSAQTVNGTVEVSNLPVDVNGALLVRNQPPVAVYDLGPTVITNSEWVTDPIPTDGYNVAGFRLITQPCNSGGGNPLAVPEWEWEPGLWEPHGADQRSGYAVTPDINRFASTFLWIQGPRVRVHVYSNCPNPLTVTALKVQLRAD